MYLPTTTPKQPHTMFVVLFSPHLKYGSRRPQSVYKICLSPLRLVDDSSLSSAVGPQVMFLLGRGWSKSHVSRPPWLVLELCISSAALGRQVMSFVGRTCLKGHCSWRPSSVSESCISLVALGRQVMSLVGRGCFVSSGS